jgi:TolB protein
MKNRIFFWIVVVILLILLNGCSATHTIKSNPSGATIYKGYKSWGGLGKVKRFNNTGKTTPCSLYGREYDANVVCYQVKKDGYYNSDKKFKNSTGDQTIFFTLKPISIPEPVIVPSITPTAAATTNVRDISRITNDSNPEFWPKPSPDGSEILVQVVDLTKSGHNANSIVLIRLGEIGRKLLLGPNVAYPAWFPNGEDIIYSYYAMKQPMLVKTPVNGAGMVFVSPSSLGLQDEHAHISPDGQKIVFTTKFGNVEHICVVNSNGSEFTVYVEGTSPQWGSDGNLIVFDRMIGKKSQIFTLNLGTGQVTQLTNDDSNNQLPIWSPDGKWLLFVSNRDGNYHLFVMKKDGSNLTQLTKGNSQEYYPAWSSDGYIYFSSDAGATKSVKNPLNWSYSNIWRLKPMLK